MSCLAHTRRVIATGVAALATSLALTAAPALSADSVPAAPTANGPELIGDHSVPDQRQVDAALADLKRTPVTETAPAQVTSSDDDWMPIVALCAALAAVVVAAGTLVLTLRRPGARVA